jgi:hypothetical protein
LRSAVERRSNASFDTAGVPIVAVSQSAQILAMNTEAMSLIGSESAVDAAQRNCSALSHRLRRWQRARGRSSPPTGTSARGRRCAPAPALRALRLPPVPVLTRTIGLDFDHRHAAGAPRGVVRARSMRALVRWHSIRAN